MTDLKLSFDPSTALFDLGLVSGGLALDDGLATAVYVSLFTDREARSDDRLPGEPDRQGVSDRGGWWGDQIPEMPGDRIGSRLWLLRREKRSPETLRRAREYAEEALAWLTEDGVARSVEIEVQALGTASNLVLAIGGVITRPDGGRQRFDHVWDAL